jgi:hypothetical protein
VSFISHILGAGHNDHVIPELSQKKAASVYEVLSGLSELISNKKDAVISSLASGERWKNYLDKGAGENNIAGNHQGRYLLELLQNARDAAKDCESGRVLVVVTDEAVHVANSGQPFQVDDLQVLDAVCHLSRSSKVNSTGFIGHKGIGMKSILLQAASFSITTRLSGGPVRLDFSREKTADLLITKLNENLDSNANGMDADKRVLLRTSAITSIWPTTLCTFPGE